MRTYGKKSNPNLWKGEPIHSGFTLVRVTNGHRYFQGQCDRCKLSFTTQQPIRLVCRSCRDCLRRDVTTSTQWRSVNDRYEVSPEGEVRANGSAVKLRPWKHKSGHLYVRLQGCQGRMVHLLVMQAWGPPQPKGTECRHLDGNHQNNHISNLEWGTRLENINDFRRHYGRHMTSSVSDSDRLIMKDMAVNGISRKQIAEKFGCTIHVVHELFRKGRIKK